MAGISRWWYYLYPRGSSQGRPALSSQECHLSQCLLQRWSQCQALHIHLGDLLALSRQFCVVRPDQHVMQVPQLQRKQRRGWVSSPGRRSPPAAPAPTLHQSLLQPGTPITSPAPIPPCPHPARQAPRGAAGRGAALSGENTSLLLRSTTFHRSWSSSRSSEPNLAPLVPAVVTKRITR